jgi:ribosomal protein S18 acetylase RimI-like enzyme
VGEVELRSAGDLSDDELAALLTASYEGYLFPFVVDGAAVRGLTDSCDLDRDASRVAVRDAVRVGVANLGIRDRDAWIGGVGVVPSERRRGLGRTLMEAVHEEALARGVERIWLEVIVENSPAVALYEDLGYTHVRDLEVWSLSEPGVTDAAVDEVAAAEAHAWIRDHRVEREPWQRDDAALAKEDGARGLVVDGAAAVVLLAAPRVRVLQVAGEQAALETLLAHARTLGEALGVLNLPEGHAAGVALERLGGRVDVRQHEMLLRLQAGDRPTTLRA